MLAELTPRPDQVTVAVNTSQFNIVEMMDDDDLKGTSIAIPALYEAYREMTVPAGPGWVEEHVKRLSANGIQSHFQLAHIAQLDTLERMMRRGKFYRPADPHLGRHRRRLRRGQPLHHDELHPAGAGRRGADHRVLDAPRAAAEHDGHRHGPARPLRQRDNLWTQDRSNKMSSVEQVEQLVRISREFGREIATGKEAKRIYGSASSIRAPRRPWPRTGFAPNRQPGQKGFLLHA
jgi:hypothetical protein